MKDGRETIPVTVYYQTVTIMVNFVDETDNPVLTSRTLLKGSMNFTFNVTNGNGNIHQGSYAGINR